MRLSRGFVNDNARLGEAETASTRPISGKTTPVLKIRPRPCSVAFLSLSDYTKTPKLGKGLAEAHHRDIS